MSIAASPSSAASSPNRTMVTVCAMVATLMQALDNTIANVALPYMQGTLSATSDQITWVLTSYVVAAAIFTAPVGWLASHFGRKRLFLVCVTGFTIASALCGMANSLTEIVAFRLLQGMFGAALVPLSQATMLDLYPPEQRGSAMAVWGMGVMVGPILGPTLGGYLTDVYNWRWVFLINVPFGILAAVGLTLFMRDTPRHEGLKFDWTGFAVLSLGLASLQLMLDRGEQLDWFNSTEIIAELVLACLGIYLFVVHLFTADNTFIPPRIFNDLNFSAGFLIMFAIGMILLSSMALLPPYLQNLGGYSITTTGLLMAPRGAGTMLAMLVAGRLTSRVDPRLLMFAGILMICASMWRMIDWTPDVDEWSLAITTLFRGWASASCSFRCRSWPLRRWHLSCVATALPYLASSAMSAVLSAYRFRRSCSPRGRRSCMRALPRASLRSIETCKPEVPICSGTAPRLQAKLLSMPR